MKSIIVNDNETQDILTSLSIDYDLAVSVENS